MVEMMFMAKPTLSLFISNQSPRTEYSFFVAYLNILADKNMKTQPVYSLYKSLCVTVFGCIFVTCAYLSRIKILFVMEIVDEWDSFEKLRSSRRSIFIHNLLYKEVLRRKGDLSFSKFVIRAIEEKLSKENSCECPKIGTAKSGGRKENDTRNFVNFKLKI